jgi:hypothetical protein
MFDPAALRQALLSLDQPAISQPAQQAEQSSGIGLGPYAALFGGEGADIASTLIAKARGAQEGNPLLGNFGAGAIAGKIGLSILAALALKHLAAAGHPAIAKALGYGSGAGLGAVAAHNLTVGQ